MLLSNWNWNTLEVTGGGGEGGGEEEGRKAGGGDSGRGTEGREKRGTLRLLDNVFIQLKQEHVGDVCTCMWKGRREEGIYGRRKRKKEGNTDGVEQCFCPIETRACWRYMYIYMHVCGRKEGKRGWILSTEVT